MATKSGFSKGLKVFVDHKWSKKPKSKASKRPVPLHPVLAAHLLNWRRETPYSKEEELVFPSFKLKGKKPPRANMLLSDHLRPAALKVGVVAPPRTFGFHTFRQRWRRS